MTKKAPLPEAIRPSRTAEAQQGIKNARGKMEARLSVDIPEELHRRLKGSASFKGMSLREYLVQLLEAQLPPLPHK